MNQLLEYEQRQRPGAVGYELPNLRMGKTSWKARNGQLPSWPPDLTKQDEIDTLNDFDDEILRAVEKEPHVHLADLDLDWWVEHGGSRTLVERARKEETR